MKPISPAEFRDVVEALLNLPAAACHVRSRTLAISGGVDSIAMAFLFSRLLRSDDGIRTTGGTVTRAVGIVVDHQIRPASGQEAQSVAQEVRKLGLGALVKRLRWSRPPSQLSNVESLARTLRYRMLGRTCRRLHATSLFFAHHRDDQYETVLMRLLTGHGYRGLGGIPPSNAIPECYDLHGVYKSGMAVHRPAEQQLHSYLRRRGPEDVDLAWDRLADLSIPDLSPLRCEAGGVMIHRPLLDFDKERLVATCEANKLRWFEDRTNSDPTLTMRNAIRYLTKSHQLPMALQKPSILALSQRSRRRRSLEDSEAHRLLVRGAVVVEFDANVGTLVVELPSLRLSRCRCSSRLFAPARKKLRLLHRRVVAAAAMRKLIHFVIPELHLPPLSSLDGAVDRLFPALRSDPEPDSQRSEAFTMAGVLFRPIEGPTSSRWFLSRAPLPASRPLPKRTLPRRAHEPPARWRRWRTAQLWDGRFWLQISTRASVALHVMHLMPQHVKSFRLALAPEQRGRLQRLLKKHAPGKTRYSLPALYSAPANGGGSKLLALPSLGIHVPGLERWIRYSARYRQVDASLLDRSKKPRAPS
ncbi:hypothetical protein L249_0319 [Ophiocordyceps polyrhachis-furcata BCC 54312]|uniref:tRNA(Ile)-lysidine synthetase n=1 Tax=Ophiocordyceps polyrhachis-furcata BCC 54312 TaxID=1330021 RepID=A0A367LDV5_9HYPO|nr:hypothetical protein L249_0319 [Ophiocordyceps polyrhachis-furcata BCC 54312]